MRYPDRKTTKPEPDASRVRSLGDPSRSRPQALRPGARFAGVLSAAVLFATSSTMAAPPPLEQRAEAALPPSPDPESPAVVAASPPTAVVETDMTDLGGRPHATFQFSVGLLALPAAEVCPAATDSCEPGETSIALSFKNLFHVDKFAVGGGITWAFGLRAGAAAGDEDGSLGREHTRSYFLFEALFRYYALSFDEWDVFAAAQLGGVVVRDSWSVLADREPYSDVEFVGPRSATMGTEGLNVGIGLGLQWNFIEEGVFGSWFNYANWFLPGDREVSPTGDQASLAGRLDVLDFGLAIAYQLPI